MELNQDFIVAKAKQLAIIKEKHEDFLKQKRTDINAHPEMAYPPYYDGYQKYCVEFDNVLVHSMKGIFPERLFSLRSPNMEQKEFEYIKHTYKQVTLPVYVDFVNSVYKCFNDGNWSVDLKESHKNGEDSFSAYIEKNIDTYRSLETWMKTILIPTKLRDAMGVVAIKPEYAYKKNEETGEVELDDRERPEPIPVYYNTKQVLNERHEGYSIILLEEKSPVKYNNQILNIGLVFEFYDSVAIYKVAQFGKKQDNNFQIVGIEMHSLGYMPVVCLMGTPLVEESKVCYQSPMQYAVDNLDLVLLNQANLQASISKCVFPYRVMIGNECDFKTDEFRCVDGLLWINNGNKATSQFCPTCKGSGLKTRISPLGEMLLRPDEGKEIDIDKALKYVAPPTETLDFLIKEIQRNDASARQILHLGITETDKVQGNGEQETASGKWIDQKSHYAFIKPISDQVFYIYSFVLNTIGRMRYDSFEEVVVNAPISFEFNTEEDYVEQMKAVKDAGMPQFVLYTIMYKFLSSLYYTEQETMAVFTLLLNADRLSLLDSTEISVQQSKGLVEDWEVYLHSSAVQLINEILRGNEKFLQKELSEQIAELQNLAQKKTPKRKVVEVKPIDLLA